MNTSGEVIRQFLLIQWQIIIKKWPAFTNKHVDQNQQTADEYDLGGRELQSVELRTTIHIDKSVAPQYMRAQEIHPKREFMVKVYWTHQYNFEYGDTKNVEIGGVETKDSASQNERLN